MRRGEVWWWHEPDRKPRPVCILTRDEAIGVLADLHVVPATTTIRGIGTEVALDTDDGMPRECVLSLDGITTAPKAQLIERQTLLSPARMHQVCQALALATGC